MERVVYRNLGLASSRILVGPGRGLDNGVLFLGRDRVMILTVDPVSVVPSLGMDLSAWLSVHLVASDYATSGLRPEFATFDFNFPTKLSAADEERYIEAVGAACKELEISIVAGHTGSYPGAGFTVIGAGMMFGYARKGAYITPAMSRAGDAIIMTKGVAIETAATLANSFPVHTREKVGSRLARKASSLIHSCSTVKDSLAAASVGVGRGGVTSMHDATEGGLLGALDEMAYASDNSMMVDMERVLVSEEVRVVCEAFNLNPLTSLSEGTLLVTCNDKKSDAVTDSLERVGLQSSVIGRVGSGRGLWVRKGSGPARRVRPTRDMYWDAYSKAVRSRLG
jgi:hydrogenase maturation factor